MELRKGQKISLNEKAVTLKFERNSGALDIDTSAFLLSANGKAAGDEDFVFYGNPTHNSASVTYQNDGALFVNLEKIPRHIEKIAITATIYEAEKRRQNFSLVKDAVLRVKGANGYDVATFKLENFTVETAIVLGEIYRYKGAWKFNATGAGFSGGLAALCKNFGIEVSDDMTAPPEVEPPPTPKKVETRRDKPPKKTAPPLKIPPPNKTSNTNENPPAQERQPKKIELKKGQKVNLVKQGKTLGEIVINLNWAQPSQQSRGLLSSIFGSKGIDLDLCCLYELQDGEIGAVQALGRLFGNLDYKPYIELDGDDRTGAISDGENLRVNGKYIDKIKRILIYTFIYEGAANWEEARGVVTVNCPGSPELVVRMDEYGSQLHTCAIALLENVGGTLSVEKIIRFYRDSKEMDEDFNWGLRWTVGRKD
ncbi:MAG: TerD domain-containing protein [Selenomonadaceae bacterium]|nr:TerD domain-containing protein [Selenomonadaceae bacterium]